MSQLIASMLEITRLDQGTQKVNWEYADLSDLVTVICDEQAMVARRGIRIGCAAEPDIFIDMDVFLMSRVVQNLLDNAFKFGIDGGWIHVALRRTDTGAQLTVQDNGVGIAQEDLDRIWQRFYQPTPAGRKARGWVWACRWCSRSWRSTAAQSPSQARRAAARRSRSRCRNTTEKRRSNMKKTVLRAYARLIAEVGARVQKGQDVVIEAELDQPEFVTMVADACYHAGARKVTVTWKHQALEKLAIRRESVKTLQTVEDWERAKLQHYVDTLPCRIYLLSEDPDGLRGVSPAKMASARQGRYSVIKPYRDQMEGRYQWCIAAVPGVAWAKKVFPHETKSRAVESSWERFWQHLAACTMTLSPRGTRTTQTCRRAAIISTASASRRSSTARPTART